MYKLLIFPLLRAISIGDHERAHLLALKLLEYGSAEWVCALIEHYFPAPKNRAEVFGIWFPNKVGLAAGFDKDARALPALQALGFGFIEVGAVLLRGQPGNPRPRQFRLVVDRALINRMGFNSKGVEAVLECLQRVRGRIRVPVGINIGLNKDTPHERAAQEYHECVSKLCGLADYFSVNVSSPNTAGLRDLQKRQHLKSVLGATRDALEGYAHLMGLTRPTPQVLKVAPDLDEQEHCGATEIAQQEASGICVGNTTLSRKGLRSRYQNEQGGLSGEPQAEKTQERVALTATIAPGFPVIAAGGIDPKNAKQVLKAGASLLQVYTSFVYEGPGIAHKINRALTA